MNIEEQIGVSRVVIIDDKYEEGAALQKALNNKGISSVFYSDEDITQLREKLPKEPLKNCRLVFLDLDFAGITDTNPITKADRPVQFLKSIVGEISAYVVIIWSSKTTEAIAEQFIKRLNKQIDHKNISSPVVPPIVLEKTDYYFKSSQDYDIQKLQNDINTRLSHISSFKTFLHGEKQSLEGVSSMYSKVISNKEDESLIGTIKELAKASAGQHIPEDKMIESAFMALGEFMPDAIEEQILNTNFDNLNLSTGSLNDNEKSELNKSLIFSEAVGSPISGLIYKLGTENFDLEKSFKATFSTGFDQVSDFSLEKQIYFVVIDVTQLCDSGKLDANRYFVNGIIHPKKFAREGQRGVELKPNKHGIYMIDKMFDFKDKSQFKLTINLKSYSSDKNQIDGLTPIIRLRSNIVVDIQHKIASFISRPGHLWL